MNVYLFCMKITKNRTIDLILLLCQYTYITKNVYKHTILFQAAFWPIFFLVDFRNLYNHTMRDNADGVEQIADP